MSWATRFINWMTSTFSFGKKAQAALPEPPPVLDPLPAKTPEEPKPGIPKTAKVNFLRELIRESEKWVGTHEKGGNNQGPDVARFQKAVDGKAQGEPWCACFVQFCVKEVQMRLGATVVMASSEHCMTIWTRTSGVHRYRSPKAGFVVIWNYEGTANGHIGIVTRVIDEFTIETIEGNTSPDDNTIEREGDGVYRKIRTTKTIGKMKLVGFIAPFNPETVERPDIKVE